MHPRFSWLGKAPASFSRGSGVRGLPSAAHSQRSLIPDTALSLTKLFFPAGVYEAAGRLWIELYSTGNPGTGEWTDHRDGD